MITRDIIAALVGLGRSGLSLIPTELGTGAEVWRRLLIGHEPWQALGASLDEDDLNALIRGLVLLGGASGWSGGSVSPVIPLYQAYLARFPDTASRLGDWVLSHRINEYEPFGGFVPKSITSVAAWDELRLEQSRHRARQANIEEQRQNEAAEKRAGRATERLLNAVRRGDRAAVAALLSQGANPRVAVDNGNSLVAIAQANGHLTLAEYLRERGIT